MHRSIREQIRRNLVAIISLVVAVSGLSYNTWRNEVSETNRNVRSAGFQMLLQLGSLQQVVFFSHYEMDAVRGSPRLGWGHVLMIGDLGQIMPSSIGDDVAALASVWSQEWENLGQEEASAGRIGEAIDALRGQVLITLRSLD